MKKIQIVFAVVAVLTASAGVLGNAMLPEDTYFQSTSPTVSCVTPATVEPCTTGIDERCVIVQGGLNPDLYISKKVNGESPCVAHMRPD